MVWAEKTDTAAGDATRYGAPDIKKISQLFNGVTNVDTVTIDSSTTIENGKLTVEGMTIADGTDIVLDTTTGTKIGTDPTQKLAFFNATPITQPAANADTSGATLPNLEIEVNQLKQLLRNLGLLAT